MRWVEASTASHILLLLSLLAVVLLLIRARIIQILMANYYQNPAAVHNALKSERWVKRQHHGACQAHHHARFMRPHFQMFPTASYCMFVSKRTPTITQLLKRWVSLTLRGAQPR